MKSFQNFLSSQSWLAPVRCFTLSRMGPCQPFLSLKGRGEARPPRRCLSTPETSAVSWLSQQGWPAKKAPAPSLALSCFLLSGSLCKSFKENQPLPLSLPPPHGVCICLCSLSHTPFPHPITTDRGEGFPWRGFLGLILNDRLRRHQLRSVGNPYALTPRDQKSPPGPGSLFRPEPRNVFRLQKEASASSACLEYTLDTFPLNSEWRRRLDLAPSPNVVPSVCPSPAPPRNQVFIPSRSKGGQ